MNKTIDFSVAFDELSKQFSQQVDRQLFENSKMLANLKKRKKKIKFTWTIFFRNLKFKLDDFRIRLGEKIAGQSFLDYY